eukprot:3211564-Rhodomonas_salina.2
MRYALPGTDAAYDATAQFSQSFVAELFETSKTLVVSAYSCLPKQPGTPRYLPTRFLGGARTTCAVLRWYGAALVLWMRGTDTAYGRAPVLGTTTAYGGAAEPSTNAAYVRWRCGAWY